MKNSRLTTRWVSSAIILSASATLAGCHPGPPDDFRSSFVVIDSQTHMVLPGVNAVELRNKLGILVRANCYRTKLPLSDTNGIIENVPLSVGDEWLGVWSSRIRFSAEHYYDSGVIFGDAEEYELYEGGYRRDAKAVSPRICKFHRGKPTIVLMTRRVENSSADDLSRDFYEDLELDVGPYLYEVEYR